MKETVVCLTIIFVLLGQSPVRAGDDDYNYVQYLDYMVSDYQRYLVTPWGVTVKRICSVEKDWSRNCSTTMDAIMNNERKYSLVLDDNVWVQFISFGIGDVVYLLGFDSSKYKSVVMRIDLETQEVQKKYLKGEYIDQYCLGNEGGLYVLSHTFLDFATVTSAGWYLERLDIRPKPKMVKKFKNGSFLILRSSGEDDWMGPVLLEVAFNHAGSYRRATSYRIIGTELEKVMSRKIPPRGEDFRFKVGYSLIDSWIAYAVWHY